MTARASAGSSSGAKGFGAGLGIGRGTGSMLGRGFRQAGRIIRRDGRSFFALERWRFGRRTRLAAGSGRRRSPHTAGFDDLADLFAIESFVFEQGFGNGFELIAIVSEKLNGARIGVIAQLADFLVDFLRRRFAVFAALAEITPE